MSKLTLPHGHPYENGRTCTTCGVFKPASEYKLERDSRASGGIAMRSKCRPCNEFRSYKAHIKRNYGISYEEYEAIRSKQGGKCAICGNESNNNSRTYDRLFVDHCHETGKVRGLLCSSCNHALGLMKDDTKLLKLAIDYLNENHTQHP